MLVLLIIGFVRVSSGALVHVAATAVETVVGLAHALVLLSDLVLQQFLKLPVEQPWRVFRLRIGEMAAFFFFNLIHVYFGHTAAAFVKHAFGELVRLS